MANSILVGGKQVNVYDNVVELTTTNIQANPSITSPVWEDAFNQGTLIGSTEQSLNYATGSCSINGGRTSLYDNGELVVSAAYDASSTIAPQQNVDVNIVHQNGETVEDFYSGTFSVMYGVNGDSTYDILTEYRWIALPFKYTNSSLPDEQKVTNYKVFSVYKVIRKRRSTGAIDTSYNFISNPIVLNFAYHNGRHNTYLRMEEIPPGPEPDEPPFDPTEDPEPYNPTIDDTSDLVNIPGNPLIGVTSAGFINVYNPAINALQGLGDILFPNVASATDVIEAILKLCETLANQNLINYVIDCHVIPVQPQIGTNANIKVGFRDTGISVPRVTNDYIDATCGSLNIREYFGGFQDFLATRSKLYLPFIGFVDVRPEFWQGGTLSVDYKFNVIDGSFMCYVRSVSSKSQLNGSVIAQYAGNACLHFPLTGVNYSQMVSGIVGAAVTMASGGGSTAVLGGALSAANTVAAGGNVQQSNGYSSTAALMGVRTPFLLIERAVPAYSAKYAHDKGFPTNIATLLSNVTGYTEILDIDLTGLPFTADELNELRQLLAEGVYF